jgi:hypothetical protein
MKQETLEEAAEKYINDDLDLYESLVDGHISYNVGIDLLNKLFKKGAKWQQERSYSEAIEFAEWIRIKDFQTASKDNWIGLDMKYYTTKELFEQFKNLIVG